MGKILLEYQNFIKQHGITSAYALAKKFFIESYLRNKHGTNKFNHFVPCSIYTFRYESPYVEDAVYRDMQPIFFSVSSVQNKNTLNFLEYGFDLNYFPLNEKLMFLDIIYELLPENVRRALEKNPEQYNVLGVNGTNSFNKIYEYLNTHAEVHGYKSTIRAFNRKYISNINVINITNWYLLGCMVPPALEGLSMSGIKKRYQKYKK